jgi:hypothetical protein
MYEYDDIPRLPYIQNALVHNRNCHYGQRKLLLTEIEFYAKCTRSSNNPKLIIYPGSAMGEKLPIILDLFPDLKFLLVDPNFHSFDKYKFKYVYQNVSAISIQNYSVFAKQIKSKKDGRDAHLKKNALRLQNVEFLNNPYEHNVLLNAKTFLHNKVVNTEMKRIMDIFNNEGYKHLVDDIFKSDERIFIIQDYMRYDLTERIKESIEIYRIKNNLDIFFLSDIRSNVFALLTNPLWGEAPSDLDFLWNYALQIIFLKVLRPTYSILKFRPMYFQDKFSDIIKTFNKVNKNNMKSKDNIFNIIKNDLDIVKKKYGVDMFKNYMNNKLYFFKCNFNYIQPWAPVGSPESRLFVSEENINNFVLYDQKEWDDKYFFIKYHRMFSYYDFYHKYLKNSQYDGCYDCYREITIICNYLLNQQGNVTRKIDIESIKKMLQDGNTQKLYEINKLINKYVYFDLKPTYKCPFNNSIIKKQKYIILNKYIRKDDYFIMIGIKISKGSPTTIDDVLYAYRINNKYSRRQKIVNNNFTVNTTKENLFLELKT